MCGRNREKVNEVWPRNCPQFYHLYWRREIDAAKAYWAWLGKRASLGPVFKFWGFALTGDIEQSLDHLESLLETTTPLLTHVNTRRVLPTSTVEEIERHPRYRHCSYGTASTMTLAGKCSIS